MTIYEALFGTPEAAAKTINELHTCFYVDRMRELGVEVDDG